MARAVVSARLEVPRQCRTAECLDHRNNRKPEHPFPPTTVKMADAAPSLGDFFKSKSKKKVKASNLNKDSTTTKPEDTKKETKQKEAMLNTGGKKKKVFVEEETDKKLAY